MERRQTWCGLFLSGADPIPNVPESDSPSLVPRHGRRFWVEPGKGLDVHGLASAVRSSLVGAESHRWRRRARPWQWNETGSAWKGIGIKYAPNPTRESAAWPTARERGNRACKVPFAHRVFKYAAVLGSGSRVDHANQGPDDGQVMLHDE